MNSADFPLAELEPRLRGLLPAYLYALSWVDPSPDTLNQVFNHLRTLQNMLYGHLSRPVLQAPPRPGELRYRWQEGTLIFTDLAGFTPLMEANAAHGKAGAVVLLAILNDYFSAMLEVIGKSGGEMLEFTGDALLIQFPSDTRGNDTAQAVRAGLRMQRSMARFERLATPEGPYSLRQRVGIHTGRFLTADIGTPFRMERVLLGSDVHRAKLAEGAGTIGRVCLTEAARARVQEQFRWEPGEPGYWLVADDLDDAQLGEYDLAPARRRLPSALLLDRSVTGLVKAIGEAVTQIEPLASYLPFAVRKVLIENAAQREIPPEVTMLTVMFVNLIGLAEQVDRDTPEVVEKVVTHFSRLFALINAAVEARDGVLRGVTYHLVGSDMMIIFGAPNGHTNDARRAAEAALAIRDLIAQAEPLRLADSEIRATCKIGLASGLAFTAEIGDPRGRRAYNALGDAANTAARLMKYAETNQILATEPVYCSIQENVSCTSLAPVMLKGKAAPVPVFALESSA